MKDREIKGAFYTPQIWVELSQKYLADTLGEDWQEEYYIWDCAAGTGNLLAGLTNKYNIWASTLDRQDVDVMKDRIKNGANLLESHVFQFDFLNDEFSKLPTELQKIINNPEERKKLVIYINPPYVESNGMISKTRSNVQITRTHAKYSPKLEKVSAELFAQFLARIYFEIEDCIIAQFSTLKVISASNSETFRRHFLAKIEKCFIVPASTFDNVKGQFPIGFFVWNTSKKEKFESIIADVFNANGQYISNKNIYSYDTKKTRLNHWLKENCKINQGNEIAILVADAPDIQHNNSICLQNERGVGHFLYFSVNQYNIICASVYFAIRKCIAAKWLNDRDQFLYPNDNWKTDTEFQNDCLVYTLFHGQNRISSKEGINHWLPFKEQEVDSKEKFASNFMFNFIQGKLKAEKSVEDLLSEKQEISIRKTPLVFSSEAKAVFVAGLELWKYYHAQENVNVNASLYDIREYFQGRSEKGKMNNKSEDETYNKLIGELRKQVELLAQKIEPKVYQYGFLKG
jgi:hypothetical protein